MRLLASVAVLSAFAAIHHQPPHKDARSATCTQRYISNQAEINAFGSGAISGSSPANVWLVGSASSKPLALKITGVQSIDESPIGFPAIQSLTAVATSGPNDVWSLTNQPLTALHWNGTVWSSVTLPEAILFISDDSSTDAWAKATSGHLLHWNGVTWSVFPKPTGMRISAIYAKTPRNVTIVGGNIIWNWDGTRWVRHVVPHASLKSTVDYLVMGTTNGGRKPLLLIDRSGHWVPLKLPTGTVNGVSGAGSYAWTVDNRCADVGCGYEVTDLNRWNGKSWRGIYGEGIGPSSDGPLPSFDFYVIGQQGWVYDGYNLIWINGC